MKAEDKKIVTFCRESLKYFIDLSNNGIEIKNIDKIKEQYNLSDEELLKKALAEEVIGVEKIK